MAGLHENIEIIILEMLVEIQSDVNLPEDFLGLLWSFLLSIVEDQGCYNRVCSGTCDTILISLLMRTF